MCAEMIKLGGARATNRNFFLFSVHEYLNVCSYDNNWVYLAVLCLQFIFGAALVVCLYLCLSVILFTIIFRLSEIGRWKEFLFIKPNRHSELGIYTYRRNVKSDWTGWALFSHHIYVVWSKRRSINICIYSEVFVQNGFRILCAPNLSPLISFDSFNQQRWCKALDWADAMKSIDYPLAITPTKCPSSLNQMIPLYPNQKKTLHIFSRLYANKNINQIVSLLMALTWNRGHRKLRLHKLNIFYMNTSSHITNNKQRIKQGSKFDETKKKNRIKLIVIFTYSHIKDAK